MSENKSHKTTGLLLSKEHRLFGLVEYAIFRGEADAFQCVTEWEFARSLLVETHFDLVMIDESAVGNETFESFSSFVKMLAAENTVCAFFVRTMTPDLELIKKVLDGVLHFVDMTRGKEEFLETLSQLKENAHKAHFDEQRKRQTISLDETMGRVEKGLPLFSSDSVEDVSFSRILYAIRFRRLYGTLKLSHVSGGSQNLRFVQGRLVDCTKEQISYLLKFFKKPEGRYNIDEDPEARASLPDNAIEPMDLIWEGALTCSSISLMETFLAPYRKKRLIPTNLFRERRVRYSGIGALMQLVEACQRYDMLEDALTELKDLADQEVLAAAVFAIATDMLVEATDDTHRLAQVVYPREVRQQRQKATDRAKQSTKAFRITLSDLQRVQIEDELRARAEAFEKASPYEILDVWEGCGKKVVNESFYKAVREHHPDTYGGNVSAESKKLADRVFVSIQKARSELLRRESAQTVPQRPGGSATEASHAAAVGAHSATMASFASVYDDQSVSSLRAGLMDISSEISDVDDFGELGGEVSDPEIRKQRIRALHEKRRRLSSVNNLLTQPSIARTSRRSSSEVPALSKLTGPSTAQVTGVTGGRSSVASRTDRLERLSNRPSAGHPTPIYVKASEGLLSDGIEAFDRSDWTEAIKRFTNAQRYAPENKRIEVYLWYSRYKLDPTTYSKAAISNLLLYADGEDTAFEANRFLGNIYKDLSNWKQASQRYRLALDAQDDPDVQELYDEVLERIEEKPRSSSLLSKFFSKKR